MLRSTESLDGFDLMARDGSMGQVKDFFFDDQEWVVRYLVVETGRWLSSRKVLIAPAAVSRPEWDAKRMPVDLDKEQVKNSPSIDTDQPVSRQHEADLNRYYGWPLYWGGAGYAGGTASTGALGGAPVGAVIAPGFTGASAAAAADNRGTRADGELERTTAENDAAAAREREPQGDPHLRSMAEVSGYHIEATDGSLGHVEDFILDDASWEVRYLVVDTRNWWPGKKVLVSPQWIKDVSWAESSVWVDLTREAIKSSPEYDPSQPVDDAYSERLHAHYGRQRRPVGAAYNERQ